MKKIMKTVSLIMAIIMLVQVPLAANAAFDAPTLTRGEWDELYEDYCDENTLPMLCVGADESSVSLVWHADKDKAQPKVRLAEKKNMDGYKEFTGKTAEAENDDQVVCRVIIDGLKENTTYYYKWYSDNGWSKAYKYETKSFTDHKAIVVGDIQIGGQSEESSVQSDVGYNWNNVLAKALQDNPDISYLVSPGDNTSTGKTADEWQTLLMPAGVRNLPMALAIGNHDKKGMAYNYYTNMPNEYFGKYFEGLDRDFWFRYGDVLYLVFDATSASAADHMGMAKEAIEKNPDAKWRIGVMHQALFGPSVCAFSAETQILLNAVFTPIFDTFDVDLVLTGHSHMQGRSNFMYESMTIGKAESGKTYTDPLGTVYLNTNAFCDHSSFEEYEFLNLPYVAYSFGKNDVTTYTTLEFKGDSMEIKTMRGDNSELLDSLTIVKTKDDHNDDGILKKFHRLLYKVVEVLGWVYLEGDKITVAIRGGHF
ncbi:MAG: metallophosphoesterase family protein [Clostridia bacterium]|nr:metallophosphoesterase family protein [Clostridia bacterium]